MLKGPTTVHRSPSRSTRSKVDDRSGFQPKGAVLNLRRTWTVRFIETQHVWINQGVFMDYRKTGRPIYERIGHI